MLLYYTTPVVLANPIRMHDVSASKTGITRNGKWQNKWDGMFVIMYFTGGNSTGQRQYMTKIQETHN